MSVRFVRVSHVCLCALLKFHKCVVCFAGVSQVCLYTLLEFHRCVCAPCWSFTGVFVCFVDV